MRQRLRAIGVLSLMCAPSTVSAQVLTIGETLGKGKSAVLLSDNVIYPGDGIPSLNIGYHVGLRRPPAVRLVSVGRRDHH